MVRIFLKSARPFAKVSINILDYIWIIGAQTYTNNGGWIFSLSLYFKLLNLSAAQSYKFIIRLPWLQYLNMNTGVYILQNNPPGGGEWFIDKWRKKMKNETHKLNPDHHFSPLLFNFRVFLPNFFIKYWQISPLRAHI